MADIIDFILGGVKLDKFEVPEEFEFGFELNVAVHRYIDSTGLPVVKTHSQGAFPLPTSWKGTLYNSTAINKALNFDVMLRTQQVIIFQYGPLQWHVLIKRFKATVKHQFEIIYEIELIVLDALNGTGTEVASVTPFNIGAQNFYQQAQDGTIAMQAADTALPQSIITSVTSTNKALASAFPLQSQSITTLLGIQNSIATTMLAIQAYSTPLMSTAVLEADLARLNASLAALQGYSLLNNNLSQLTGVKSSSQTISNFTGDLYRVAATYYPKSDPALSAPIIAQANGLYDNYVDTPMTLSLPPIFNTL